MRPGKKDLKPYCQHIHLAAQKYQVSTRTVRRWLDAHGLYSPKMGYGPGKLSSSKATEIRRLYRSDKYTQVELAEMFNVTQAMICRIVNNRAYRVDVMVTGRADVK